MLLFSGEAMNMSGEAVRISARSQVKFLPAPILGFFLNYAFTNVRKFLIG